MEAGALLEMKRFCHARTVSSPCGVFPVRWSCPPASSTHTARAPSPPPPPAVAHPARRGGGVEFFLDPPATSLFFSRLPGRPPVRHSDATGRPAVTLSFPQLSRSQQRRRAAPGDAHQLDLIDIAAILARRRRRTRARSLCALLCASVMRALDDGTDRGACFARQVASRQLAPFEPPGRAWTKPRNWN